MYTIFKNDTSIILTDKGNIPEEKHHFLWKDIRREKGLDRILSMTNVKVYLIDEDLEGMWSEFKQHFKIIEASGGIVKNDLGQILFIFRNGIWDLPKGKIEAGETKEEAGLREVEEECGLSSLTLGNFIETTYHLYKEKETEVLKVSYWYEMSSNQKDLSPQLEEGITDLKWIGPSDLDLILDNTYPNISLLLEMYQFGFQ
jgi:8-oxo-dGTP pyrophosphatase MutT (NUDIX family)